MAKLNITAADRENLNNLDNNFEQKTEWFNPPVGDYEVTVKSMRCKECPPDKKHDEEFYKVSIGFRILNGEYADKVFYYNQNLDKVWMLKNLNKFLASLKPDVDMIPTRYVIEDEFNMDGYNAMLEEIYDDITSRGLEYHLVVGETNTGWQTYSIAEVFD